jgi:serine/tyrosine/threonine adenylyltransferase
MGLYSFGRQPEAVFWSLRQLAGALTLATEADPLVATLNSFSAQYRAALAAAMLRRLGLAARSPDEDVDLVNAAFKALAEGGEALRWEPFFFDWFGGLASEPRALAGARAALYGGEAFADFRAKLQLYEMERPGRLAAPYFSQAEPEELLYDEIEQIWAAIAGPDDDWGPFEAKLQRIEAARLAWGYAQLQ